MVNCEVIDFKANKGNNIGYLVAIEGNNQIKFDIKRVYYILETPKSAVRGFHAHRELLQVLICIRGSIAVDCEDINGNIKRYILGDPTQGLFVGKMVWHTMEWLSEDAVLFVLASDFYNEDDYIRQYDKFITLSERRT